MAARFEPGTHAITSSAQSIASPSPAGVGGVKGKKRREVTDEQRQEMREAFSLFDEDKDGLLDYHELKVRCTVSNGVWAASHP